MSQASDCAAPTATEASVKTPSPAMNTRRRPSRSPIRAPSSSRPPNASRYAFCTHDRAVAENCRSPRIFGSAVITIEMSITIIA